MRVLVAEKGQHTIEACRHLAREGHQVVLASLPLGRLGRFPLSRSYHEVVESDVLASDRRIEGLKRIFDREGCDVFLPFGFRLVTEYIESSWKEPSLRMNVPYGGREEYWRLSDKSNLYRTLRGSSVPLPRSHGTVREGDTVEIGNDDFPVILKRARGVGIKGNIILAWSKGDIESFLEGEGESEFVIQEYLPGDIFDVGGFAFEGEARYMVPQRRTVTLPLRGGVAAVNDVYPDEELTGMTSEIVERAGWSGPFQAEFRWDPEGEAYKLIEVNAKLWGSLPLSLRANPDILNMILKYATGGDPGHSLHFDTGLRYRWICGQELQALRFGSLGDWISFLGRFLGGSHYDFDLRDPVPDLMRLVHSIYQYVDTSDLPRPLVDRETHRRLNRAR
ncbi:MAG: ATP-grasp domain-containing protein [Methanomassiliicoccales archaeon]